MSSAWKRVGQAPDKAARCARLLGKGDAVSGGLPQQGGLKPEKRFGPRDLCTLPAGGPEGSAMKHERQHGEMTAISGSRAGPRIYNLPSQIGPMIAPPSDLARIAAMGFDWIYVDLFAEPAASGSARPSESPAYLWSRFP